MKRFIQISSEDRKYLCKAFRCTERTVFNAINFDEQRGNTTLAKKIRHIALQRGGVVMVVLPEKDVVWTEANK